jgi:8-oxo-dGTP diphosphatase
VAQVSSKSAKPYPPPNPNSISLDFSKSFENSAFRIRNFPMFRVWRFIKTLMGIIFRHPITGVTIVPILPDGHIVLVRRRDTDQWGLPGGIVDWGEDIATTLKRELKEETGLDVIKIRRLVGVYSSFDRDPRIHSISVSVAVEVQGSLRVEDTLEISAAQAFPSEALPLGNLAHDHDRQLQDYLQGVTALA